MLRLVFPALFAALTLSPPSAAQAQTNELGQIRKEMRAGNVRSLREIEQRVLPMMPGREYLGPEYDAVAMVYRLKFIRDGRVTFVDVDARSGNIVGQSR